MDELGCTDVSGSVQRMCRLSSGWLAAGQSEGDAITIIKSCKYSERAEITRFIICKGRDGQAGILRHEWECSEDVQAQS